VITAALAGSLPAALPAQGALLPGAQAELHLAFAGDIMGHEVNYRMSDYHDIYRGVQDMLQSEDLSFANLELPVDPFRPASGYPWFNGTPAYLAAAVDAGFNLFSLANNHAFDGGTEGVLQTIRALEAARPQGPRPYAYSGTRGNPARPFDISLLSVKGVRVGFLALSQFLNEQDSGRYVHVVDYSRPDQTGPFLDWVRSVAPLYDLLIVSYHGDQEYVQTPSPSKRAFFRALVEAGAGIVVGHHPHVVQGYEIVQAGGMRRLVMYSMGNFISGMTWMVAPSQLNGMLAATGESYLMQAQVRCGSGGGGCTVLDAAPIPIANYQDEHLQVRVARMEDLADGTVAVSAEWRAYYARRLELMREFLGAR